MSRWSSPDYQDKICAQLRALEIGTNCSQLLGFSVFGYQVLRLITIILIRQVMLSNKKYFQLLSATLANPAVCNLAWATELNVNRSKAKPD